MRGHHPWVQESSEIPPTKFRAVCTCRQAGLFDINRSAAEDWIYTHMEQVLRARTGLRTRTPSLASQRDWFVSQAENPEVPENERDLWNQLAREISSRLNDRGEKETSESPLF